MSLSRNGRKKLPSYWSEGGAKTWEMRKKRLHGRKGWSCPESENLAIQRGETIFPNALKREGKRKDQGKDAFRADSLEKSPLSQKGGNFS